MRDVKAGRARHVNSLSKGSPAPVSYRLETTRSFEKDFRKLALDLKRRVV